jgi:pyruvate formate lyase activating enzyme
MRWLMAASGATSARASASCTTVSAAIASCGRGQAGNSCSPPTAALRVSAWIRSRKSRSILNHSYPGTPVLSFGTAGCNLACKFCQNWDISKSRDMDRRS